MKLLRMNCTNDLPLEVSLIISVRYDREKKDFTILDRYHRTKIEFTLSNTLLFPGDSEKDIHTILNVFFNRCKTYPFRLHDKRYQCLYFNYERKNADKFDEFLDSIINRFSKLGDASNFSIQLPGGNLLKDYIVAIEIAYPDDWQIKYRR